MCVSEREILATGVTHLHCDLRVDFSQDMVPLHTGCVLHQYGLAIVFHLFLQPGVDCFIVVPEIGLRGGGGGGGTHTPRRDSDY